MIYLIREQAPKWGIGQILASGGSQAWYGGKKERKPVDIL